MKLPLAETRWPGGGGEQCIRSGGPRLLPGRVKEVREAVASHTWVQLTSPFHKCGHSCTGAPRAGRITCRRRAPPGAGREVRRLRPERGEPGRPSLYVGGSIPGGREDRELYGRIVSRLRRFGAELTEHLAAADQGAGGEAAGARGAGRGRPGGRGQVRLLGPGPLSCGEAPGRAPPLPDKERLPACVRPVSPLSAFSYYLDLWVFGKLCRALSGGVCREEQNGSGPGCFSEMPHPLASLPPRTKAFPPATPLWAEVSALPQTRQTPAPATTVSLRPSDQTVTSMCCSCGVIGPESG